MEFPTEVDTTTPDAVQARRDAVFALAREEPPPPVSPEAGAELPAAYVGLALSGGGIRSATFSLGVLQALALCRKDEAASGKTPYLGSLLSSIDYLSTVSGGGYVGSFLASLFLAGRVSAEAAAPPHAAAPLRAAEAALKSLSVDPPGRIHADRDRRMEDASTFPLAWLRENGRYLAPTGAGDIAYDAALALRNWIAIHYVLGTIFMLAFALLASLRLPLQDWVEPLREALVQGPMQLPPQTQTSDQAQAFAWWWSATVYLPLASFALWACPAGLAYWWVNAKTFAGVSWEAFGSMLIVLGLWVIALADPMPARRHAAAGSASLVMLSLVFYFAARVFTPTIEPAAAPVARRITLTRWLTRGLSLSVGLGVLALLESTGQSIYLYIAQGGSPTALYLSLGTAGGLTMVVKRVTALLGPPKKGRSLLARLPLMTLAGLGGIVIVLCIALAWSCAFAWVLWGGEAPGGQPLLTTLYVALMVFAMAVLTGLFPSFINLSSLQTLYAARLTRAYLGASNGARGQASPANKRALSAAEPVTGDDVRLAAYLTGDRPNSFAPLHLINVTVASTVDPAEQLVQRDRKGLPMAVCPVGFWIDGRRFAFAVDAQGDTPSTPSVGQWVATSGAALATGLGRNTSLGLSLLLGAANVRLGTWWRCPGAATTERSTRWSARIGRFLFGTQAYLMDELQAKFFGLHRRSQYLTDGGHFENTGVYELLRPGRGVGFIFATDSGADKDYEFNDLAILIRLVRIDYGIELEVDSGFESIEKLNDVIGTPRQFRAAAEARAAGSVAGATSAPFTRSAVLLRASYPGHAPHCWVVMFKPAVPSDATEDILQYALQNPDFPQQTTADQFFDEAQWESYRKLGIDSGRRLLNPACLRLLREHVSKGG